MVLDKVSDHISVQVLPDQIRYLHLPNLGLDVVLVQLCLLANLKCSGDGATQVPYALDLDEGYLVLPLCSFLELLVVDLVFQLLLHAHVVANLLISVFGVGLLIGYFQVLVLGFYLGQELLGELLLERQEKELHVVEVHPDSLLAKAGHVSRRGDRHQVSDLKSHLVSIDVVLLQILPEIIHVELFGVERVGGSNWQHVRYHGGFCLCLFEQLGTHLVIQGLLNLAGKSSMEDKDDEVSPGSVTLDDLVELVGQIGLPDHTRALLQLEGRQDLEFCLLTDSLH